MLAEELLEQYAIGLREFKGTNLSHISLQNSVLISIDCDQSNLQSANLSAANLIDSSFIQANLSYADLRKCKLLNSNLFLASLNQANLSEANLVGANLRGANLANADMSGAYLAGANLSEADLRGANLSRANLKGANLQRANLSEANLSETTLNGADLFEAILPSDLSKPWLRLNSGSQDEIFGTFLEDLPKAEEYLSISFSPGSIPLQQRWRNNGLSADFMADYFSTFFLEGEKEDALVNLRDEIRSAVSFIANELLENAMKFSNKLAFNDTKIQLFLYPDNLIFLSTNPINLSTKAKFQSFIEELIDSDPSDLYILRLERNAENDESDGSGLGLLTMLNDYSAQLGWRFSSSLHDSNQITVQTMVQLMV